jgi:hypothetical protein
LSVLSVVVLALATATGLTSCRSTSCKASEAFALVVTVLDASGRRVCDASVTVTDGAYSAALSPFSGDESSCTYYGPTERAGTYSIEVHSGTRSKKIDGVNVTADACHVRTRSVTLTLSQ